MCGSDNASPDPVTVALPTDETTLESLEGMLVLIQTPVVTDNYDAGYYGQITVAAERQFQFTQASQASTRTPRNNDDIGGAVG